VFPISLAWITGKFPLRWSVDFRSDVESSPLIFLWIWNTCYPLIFFGCFSNRVNLVNYLTITMVKNCLLFFMTSLKILRAIILVPDFFEEPPKLPQLRNSLRARKMVWITLIMALWAQMGGARWEKVLDGGVKRISVCVGQDWSSIHQITGKQWKMIQPKIVEINETSTNRNMGYVETRCGHQLPLK
jgi:hypothetical protein